MALIAICWFMIEYSLIPDGFRKWDRLSFFIHPHLLLLCQIFLWAKLLGRWVMGIVFYPLRIVWLVCLWVFKTLRNRLVRLFVSRRSTNQEAEQAADMFEILEVHVQNQSVVLRCSRSCPSILYEQKIFEQHKRNVVEDEEDQEEEPVVDKEEVMEESNIHMDECMDMNESSSSSVCSSESEREVDNDEQQQQQLQPRQQESDPFYKKYTERMRWFDILNYDRSSGISAILNKQLGSPSSFEIIETVEFSTLAISWSKMAKRRLLRSLESDFERVYVGQSCLCWEALHHQYRKVEVLACSSSENIVFCKNLTGNFQKFQVLLERFMEDERCEGKRFWNYVRGRFSLKSLLQVPEVSGYLEEEKERMKGEAVRPIDVLKAIENSINAFWVFVKTDNKKSWMKFTSLLWTYPPVEDPKDLDLLADLSRVLQKKELWLKDLTRKKRCWMKRANKQVEESQRREILYSMIDMKLISRVLKMSMISTPQLKWCQEKLGNIDFKEGKVVRAWSDSLFPPS